MTLAELREKASEWSSQPHHARCALHAEKPSEDAKCSCYRSGAVYALCDAFMEMTDPAGPVAQADLAASVIHDFMHGFAGKTRVQAEQAIWAIHEALRPWVAEPPEPPKEEPS